MSAVPAPIAVTIAEEDPIVATALLSELHVPLPASVSADVKPTQTVVLPVIVEGVGLTVTMLVAVQPVVVVYVIPVVPDDTPVTRPDVPIVATEVAPLLHVPSEVTSLKLSVFPTQTVEVFSIADIGLIVIFIVE